jgi:hypothetical protein
MQNAECRIIDLSKKKLPVCFTFLTHKQYRFHEPYPKFCILHFAFCII